MKPDHLFMIVLAVLALVSLLLSMITWHRYAETAERVRELENQAVERTHEGGADIAAPEIPKSLAAYRFPVAQSDYLRLTSPYGYRVSPLLHVERYHAGLDIAATWRAQIVAVADGEVVEHWPAPDGYYQGHPVYGGMLVLEHATGWRSVYAHLSSTRVHTGFTVRAGQVIGRVGDTGKSDGEHLHFELRDATGRAVNPLLYLEDVRDE